MTAHPAVDVACLAVVLYGGIALLLLGASRMFTRSQDRRRSNREFRDFMAMHGFSEPARRRRR